MPRPSSSSISQQLQQLQLEPPVTTTTAQAQLSSSSSACPLQFLQRLKQRINSTASTIADKDACSIFCRTGRSQEQQDDKTAGTAVTASSSVDIDAQSPNESCRMLFQLPRLLHPTLERQHAIQLSGKEVRPSPSLQRLCRYRKHPYAQMRAESLRNERAE